MPTREIHITEHFDQFVTELVGIGRYQNASEVVQAGLRLLEVQTRSDEQKLALLKKLAAEGFDELDQGRGAIAGSLSSVKELILYGHGLEGLNLRRDPSAGRE